MVEDQKDAILFFPQDFNLIKVDHGGAVASYQRSMGEAVLDVFQGVPDHESGNLPLVEVVHLDVVVGRLNPEDLVTSHRQPEFLFLILKVEHPVNGCFRLRFTAAQDLQFSDLIPEGEIEPKNGIGQQKHQGSIDKRLPEHIPEGSQVMEDDPFEKGIKHGHGHHFGQDPPGILPHQESVPAAIPDHQNPADHHDEHTGKDDQAGKDKKHKFGNGKPVLCAKWLVDVDKDQGKQGGKEYQPGDIPFFVQVFRNFLTHKLLAALLPVHWRTGFMV